MEISEVDRRLAEYGTLIKCQLRLVRQFAKFVLDRLRESVLLAAQGLHRTWCAALHSADWTGRTYPMTAQDDFLNLIDKISIDGIEEQGDNPSLVQETSDKQENGPSTGHFEFQPLIEEEKKEFVNSLDARGKQLLVELQGRARVAAIHGLPIATATVEDAEFTTIRNRLNTTAIAA